MNLHSIKGLVMWYMHLPFRIKQYQKNNERNLARIRQKDKITVVFFASNVAMWRYQGLYDEMQRYPRFKTYIVFSPLKCFSTNELEDGFNGLRTYFKERNIEFFDFDLKKQEGCHVETLEPDILFYPQPYYTIMTYKPHRYQRYGKALLGYYPYGLFLSEPQGDFNEDMHNRAWRLFYPSEMHKKLAKQYAAIGDKNVVVTGYPNADNYLTSVFADVWKKQDKHKKRVIWAPHFTIYSDGWMNATCFLSLAEGMLALADKYKDKIQFAFKPHPRLLSELYGHPKWGKVKADSYYREWALKDNCQLEKGAFVDLFRGSDAMVHDSGSFMIEYLYTKKPVMYTSYDIETFKASISEFDKKAVNAHYQGHTIEDIEKFLIEVVVNEDDCMADIRCTFADNNLLPPNGKTVAQNTMDEINRLLSK